MALGGAAALVIPAVARLEASAVPVRVPGGVLCSRTPGTKFELGGRLNEYLIGVHEQWLKVAPESNPAMLEMFRDRRRCAR